MSENVTKWEMIERPTGRIDLPEWIKGAQVNWMDGWGNAPGIGLKVEGDVREWPDKRFTVDGQLYQARHPDGRLEQYAHGGPVTLRPLQMFIRADGTVTKHRRQDAAMWPNETYGFEPGEWGKADVLATTSSEGFGGAVIWVTMEDGREIALCGPWHVIGPVGYQEFAYVDVGERSLFHESSKRGDKRPWHARGGRAGLYLRDELAIAIYATYLPHIEIARVTYRWSGGRAFIEPLKPEWDAPKQIVMDRERAARVA